MGRYRNGYIVPVNSSVEVPTGVKEFGEKPDIARARGLIEAGALWNMFIVTGSVQTLISLFHFAFELLVHEMRRAIGGVLSRNAHSVFRNSRFLTVEPRGYEDEDHKAKVHDGIQGRGCSFGSERRAVDAGGGTERKASSVSELEMEVNKLRAENARLKMEKKILKQSDGVFREGVAVKYAAIESMRHGYPLGILCDVLSVSTSGHHE